jgi:hypothetical protein
MGQGTIEEWHQVEADICMMIELQKLCGKGINGTFELLLEVVCS